MRSEPGSVPSTYDANFAGARQSHLRFPVERKGIRMKYEHLYVVEELHGCRSDFSAQRTSALAHVSLDALNCGANSPVCTLCILQTDKACDFFERKVLLKPQVQYELVLSVQL